MPMIFLFYFFYSIFVTKIPLKLVLQRFGFFLPKSNKKDKVIWIHAVSAGEINACIKLISLFTEKKVYKIFLSTSTPTGYNTAYRINNPNVLVFYTPIDYPFAISHLIYKIKPIMLILSETELWPNMIIICKKKSIPIVQINGRIEDLSYKNYLKLKSVTKYLLNKFSVICVQNEKEKKKYLSLGTDINKLKITGNTKYDYALSNLVKIERKNFRKNLQINEKDIVILFASTHQGENEILIDIYKRLIKKFENIKIIIAPRIPEKRKIIISYLNDLGLSYSLRSKNEIFNKNIFILDTIGELFQFFSFSNIVIMGGSFSSNIGGHNIFEPAFFSKPIIVGPYNFSIQNIFLEFKNNKAIIESSKENLFKNLINLITDEKLRKTLGKKANILLYDGMGASKRTYNILMNILSNKKF